MFLGAADGCEECSIINGKHLGCFGRASCQETLIKRVENVYGFGRLSLFQSMIISDGVGELNIYLMAHESAQEMNISCNISDTCNIYCLSDDICDEIFSISCGDTSVSVPAESSFDAALNLINTLPNCTIIKMSDADLPKYTNNPTVIPTVIPTSIPTTPTDSPTHMPTLTPTNNPTSLPSTNPTMPPTIIPTTTPTVWPTLLPTMLPTMSAPTSSPTVFPSVDPSTLPTSEINIPTHVPTRDFVSTIGTSTTDSHVTTQNGTVDTTTNRPKHTTDPTSFVLSSTNTDTGVDHAIATTTTSTPTTMTGTGGTMNIDTTNAGLSKSHDATTFIESDIFVWVVVMIVLMIMLIVVIIAYICYKKLAKQNANTKYLDPQLQLTVASASPGMFNSCS